MEIFSARLKWLREKHGFTQKEMAEYLEISQPYYGRFEKGTGQPNIETLVKLPPKLNESLDFICGVVALDKKGYDLVYDYFSSRYNSEQLGERVKSTMEMLEDPDLEISIDFKLRHLARQKQRLTRLNEINLEQFKEFIHYIKDIPYVPPVMFDEELWSDEYQEYKKSRRLPHEDQED
ncbi:HTH-type transcriptional regulator ImmR [compost metagenome]